MNPGDYRVAREACGACHLPMIQAAERSLMSTTRDALGRRGVQQRHPAVQALHPRRGLHARRRRRRCHPGPARNRRRSREARHPRQALSAAALGDDRSPADIFRVFERGGRKISNQFPEIGLPNSLGALQTLEEPGRPDIRQSNRGPGTGARIAVPVLNIPKTRLNDPLMWFLGTNDQPGDYRSSGCSALPRGLRQRPRPAPLRPVRRVRPRRHERRRPTRRFRATEPGHPLQPRVHPRDPDGQCMVCHMHQPNMFVNTLPTATRCGTTSPTRRSCGRRSSSIPTAAEAMRKVLDRNPGRRGRRGKWGDPRFLENVSDAQSAS